MNLGNLGSKCNYYFSCQKTFTIIIAFCDCFKIVLSNAMIEEKIFVFHFRGH